MVVVRMAAVQRGAQILSKVSSQCRVRPGHLNTKSCEHKLKRNIHLEKNALSLK